MAILDIQRRAAQIGRIRIGNQVPSGKFNTDGSPKMRPAKLGAFRLTTSSEYAAKATADLLGGAAQRWEGAPTAGQWEVFTDRDQMSVMIPPSPTAVDSWYEMWTAAGCTRRCDGHVEQKSGQDCLCPADQALRSAQAKAGRACRMTTRVNVLIPDLPGVGQWMLESHGYYAAVELSGTAELLAQASARGLVIPAVLRIEQRERRIPRPDQAPLVNKFAVPVLEVLATLREITAAAESGQRALSASMPPAIEPVRVAISAGQPAAVVAELHDGSEPAQVLASRALCVHNDVELRQVWEDANEAGLLEEWVTVPHYDELICLGDVIKERKQDFETRGGNA